MSFSRPAIFAIAFGSRNISLSAISASIQGVISIASSGALGSIRNSNASVGSSRNASRNPSTVRPPSSLRQNPRGNPVFATFIIDGSRPSSEANDFLFKPPRSMIQPVIFFSSRLVRSICFLIFSIVLVTTSCFVATLPSIHLSYSWRNMILGSSL